MTANRAQLLHRSAAQPCDHNCIPCSKWFRFGWVCVRCHEWFRAIPPREASAGHWSKR